VRGIDRLEGAARKEKLSSIVVWFDPMNAALAKLRELLLGARSAVPKVTESTQTPCRIPVGTGNKSSPKSTGKHAPAPWKVFRHPDGRVWSIRRGKDCYFLRLGPADEEPIVRSRPSADVQSDVEKLIADQCADGFVARPDEPA
jgi:hypothetical protein